MSYKVNLRPRQRRHIDIKMTSWGQPRENVRIDKRHSEILVGWGRGQRSKRTGIQLWTRTNMAQKRNALRYHSYLITIIKLTHL